jgi:hypothetical protein
MRKLALSLAFAGLALSAAGCAGKTTTSLRVYAPNETPRAAHVVIDDEPVGSLAFIIKRGVALPPGVHRVTVEADGYLPWDAEVDAGSGGGLVRIDVKMVKKPD